ncbi:hypothetical protein FIU87_19765 [Bacillus sp. THAF10]|uniref:hypothetical protein n=1 Tax=Bacillus sp. THAF10 TaxID=2587848 RepID=UPI001267E97F|nr:hypothetical protein [Bacillus sp. THAF10]QFT90888.1 hypothetical protein FIU87_19765 [Bacillus sp. THAF10]
MQKKYLIFFVFVLLIGCQASQTFSTYEQALEFGLDEEGITEDEIIDEIKLKNEEFIIYVVPNPEGDAIRIANIFQNNGNYIWKPVSSKISLVIRNSKPLETLSVEGEIQSISGKDFIVNLGTFKDKGEVIKNEDGEEINPEFDEKRKLYYLIKENL